MQSRAPEEPSMVVAFSTQIGRRNLTVVMMGSTNLQLALPFTQEPKNVLLGI